MVAVVGTSSWATGFRPSPPSQRHHDLVRQREFFLAEAEIAEQQDNRKAADEWLDQAIAAEARLRAKPRAIRSLAAA